MGKKLFLPALAVFSITAIVVLHQGFIFLLLALLPSIVAWFADRTPEKSVFRTVFACNLATALPPLAALVEAVFNPPDYIVVSPMRQPQTWMIVYLGAAAGWSLVFFCRFGARLILTLNYKYRVTSMEAMQKKLSEEWGEDVTQKSG